MKTFSQARGSNVQLTLGFESSYATAPTGADNFKLKFNPGGLTAQRDLNTAETIQDGRSPAEPFQGNGDVSGDCVFPNDLNQQWLLLKAAFGAPTTTAPASTSAISAIAAGSEGRVVLTVASGHGVAEGDFFIVHGTANYDGEWKAVAVTSTTVTIEATYVAESPVSAWVSKSGYTHVFRIGSTQPSFTMEQLHKDVASSFSFLGCKVSGIRIGASSDGQENTVTYSMMGSKPVMKAASAITAITGSGSTATFACAETFQVGDYVCIAGTANYDGVHAVTAVASGTFSISAAYVAETVTSGQEPGCCKCGFKGYKSARPLKRLGTFSASLKKDGVAYRCAKTFELQFDMGLDGEQRIIGDGGYRSELPEGTVGVSGTLNALFKDGSLFQAGTDNATVSWTLRFDAGEGVGSLQIDIPECKIQQSSPTVDTAGGLSQSCTAQAFCTTAGNGGSAVVVTLVNAYQN